MYARKEIPTVLPDAVLRCRKLEATANIELDEMHRAQCRRMNTLGWQQQSFQKTLTERHKRWREYDRAFRLKLKRELGADLATALRLRTIQEEEDKYLFEQELIEKSFANQKKDETKYDEKKQLQSNPTVTNKNVIKSNSAHPKPTQTKVSTNTGSQSAVDARRVQSSPTKMSRTSSAAKTKPKLLPHRPRTSRFDSENRRDTDPSLEAKSDFGSVLLRILSNIAATPDLDDNFTIRKRALEARERRLILTKDDRYYNLIKELSPQKISGGRDPDDIEEDVDED